MRNLCKNKTPLLQPHPWDIVETEFAEETNLRMETIFSLGNGKIGIRGTFEEGFYGNPAQTAIGTYLNGIYEYRDYRYAWKRPGFPDRTHSMINLANGLLLSVYVDGEKVILSRNCITDYERRLDMKSGLLMRKFVWYSKKGKKIKIETERFVSMEHSDLIAISYRITPVNFSGEIEVVSQIDAEVKNEIERKPEIGSIDGIPTTIDKLVAGDAVSYVVQTTRKSNFRIGMAMSEFVEHAEILEEKHDVDCRYINHRRKLMAVQGESCVINKFVCLDGGKVLNEEKLVNSLESYQKKGYTVLREKHVWLWHRFWEVSDIRIDGDDALQQALRYDAFQLMQSAGKDGKTNIGANGLTGEGYQGHTFWDTEMYMLPFFLYTQPDEARELLMYRYYILPEAKRRAVQMDGCGALYSWNSINGEECGFVFEAATAQYHINADICYAIRKYMEATQDEEFLVCYGAEILFETSIFMVHRGCFVPLKGNQFCINVVCGPDEYTPVVDNNCYTNYLTKLQLSFAFQTAKWMEKEYPEQYEILKQRTGLDENEVNLWKKASDHMYIPYHKELDMLMQDDQYLYRDPVKIEDIPQEKLPLLTHLHPLNLWRCQVSKQADIVLLMYLRPNDFSMEMKKRVYDYYEPRTIHDSSLSVSIHSIVANDIGYEKEAYEYFMQAARMDLDDYNGNTSGGVHAACMGGTLLAILYGFAGMQICSGQLCFKPRIPEKWERYQFHVTFRRNRILIQVDHEMVTVFLKEVSGFEVSVYGEKASVQKNRICRWRSISLKRQEPSVENQ